MTSIMASSLTESSLFDKEFINVNLAGKTYRISQQMLLQQPVHSKLKKLACLLHQNKKQDLKDSSCMDAPNSFYFMRSTFFFESLIQYYISGELHCPAEICEGLFMEEAKFWEVDMNAVPNCCREKLGLKPLPDPVTSDEPAVDIMAKRNSIGYDDFVGIPCSCVRRNIWAVIENPTVSPGPWKSRLARIFAAVSVTLIAISIITLILGSMRELQKDDKEPVNALVYIEYFCVVWFTMEYFLRLLVTPRRWEFIKSIINIIDAMSIFPFHVEFFLMISGTDMEHLRNVKGALLAMRVLRLLRVVRVFKLARYSAGLQSFINTLTSSCKEIGMLGMFLSSGMLLFSTTVYFMEKDAEETPFTSIPATFWWAVVTMTTVGYGDMIPVTVGGKLVAAFATIAGVIVLAFPITMIVENFCRHYQIGTGALEDGQLGARRRLHVKSAAII